MLAALTIMVVVERLLARYFEDDLLTILVMATLGVFFTGVFRPFLPDVGKDAHKR